MSETWTSRLPSLGSAADASAAALRRFPLVLLTAAVSAAAAICAAEELGPDWLQLRLLAVATLGLPLFTAAALAAERRASAQARVIIHGGAVLVLAVVFLLWPGWSEQQRGIRYVQLSAAFHLAAAFLPFLGRDRRPGFWEYNRTLFVRFIVSAISTGTLFGGLALALLALDKLFGVAVAELGYFRLWVTIAFVFNTWFFLGELPRDLDALDAPRPYPAVLRVFAQYILTPLVSMYLVILTLYLAKVVITWDWPSQWIGWLVSGVATAGILALLLLHPIAASDEQRWVAAFAREFWLAILPAVVMLWLSIYQRVHQYGITEARYFLIVLSVWLAAVAVYFRWSRSNRIAVIPASLCAVALLTFAGPLGAYHVARASQLGRLTGLLERRGVLVNGTVRAASGGAPAAPREAREINATVRYLLTVHGPSSLAALLPDSLRARLARIERPQENEVRRVVASFGVPYVDRWSSEAAARFSFSAAADYAPIDVAEYDALLPIRQAADSTVPDTTLVAVLTSLPPRIRVMRGATVLVEAPLDSLAGRLLGRRQGRRGGEVPAAHLALTVTNGSARIRLLLRMLGGMDRNGRVEVTDARGYALVRLGR